MIPAFMGAISFKFPGLQIQLVYLELLMKYSPNLWENRFCQWICFPRRCVLVNFIPCYNWYCKTYFV